MFIRNILSFCIVLCSSYAWADVFTQEQVRGIEEVVSTYLEAHPERVVQAIRKAQENEVAAVKAKAEHYLAEHVAELVAVARPYTLEKEGARCTVIEFMDYQCGHCRLMYESMMDLGNVSFNKAFLPLPILGPASIKASTLALSATSPDEFLAVTKDLFAASDDLSDHALKKIGKKYHIKMLEDAVLEKKLRVFYDWAMHLGIQGAPAVVVTDGKRSEIFFGRISEETLRLSIERMSSEVAAQTEIKAGP